jgi:hypothetical protein
MKERRDAAAAELASTRERIERDLRANGATPAEAHRLAGEAVSDLLRERAATSSRATDVELTKVELREFLTQRGAGSVA